MNPFQLLRCIFGKHHRSRTNARVVDGEMVSNCTGCGCKMQRGFHGWEKVTKTPRVRG